MTIIPFLIGLLLQTPPPNDDPIGRNLFPPDLVMSHQIEIGLKPIQVVKIQSEIANLQVKLVELQFQMQREAESLALALQQAPIDETKSIAIAEKVMNLETNIKKQHLTLLIRIKNLLTDEQRAKLTEIQKKSGR